MSQHERWDRGTISSVMSRKLESHRPPKASVEVPNCKPDTLGAECLPHLLEGIDHALQPIFSLKRILGRRSPEINPDLLLQAVNILTCYPSIPRDKANSVQHVRPALARSLGVFSRKTQSYPICGDFRFFALLQWRCRMDRNGRFVCSWYRSRSAASRP